jgi:murein tripeptide amidase MpaA
VSIISARVHPGETLSSHVMESIIANVMSYPTSEINEMLKKTQLILIPMINVDGVTLGNYRVSFSGDDLNRTYHDPKQNHPETKELKKLVESLSKEK